MDKLKKYLEDRGIKQSFVAKKIGLTDRQMSYLVNEATSVRLDTLEKLAKALGCDVKELF